MTSEAHLAWIGVLAGASFGSSVLGFGDALVAIPLLSILFDVGPDVAAPLVSLVSVFTISGNLLLDAMAGKLRDVGKGRASAVLALSAAAGVPFGVETLKDVDPRLVKTVLGALLGLYGAVKIGSTTTTKRSQALPEKTNDASPRDVEDRLPELVPFGLAAGVLGGLASAPGPPAILLSRLERWDPVTSRVMLFKFFLPVQLCATLNFYETGLLTPALIDQAAATLPFVVLAIYCGTFLNRRIDPAAFDDLVASSLCLLGLLTVLAALR